MHRLQRFRPRFFSPFNSIEGCGLRKVDKSEEKLKVKEGVASTLKYLSGRSCTHYTSSPLSFPVLLIMIGFIDNTTLFCGSRDLLQSISRGNETPFCTISGAQLDYVYSYKAIV